MLRWSKAAVNPAQVEAYFVKRLRHGVADYYLLAEEQGIGYWGGRPAQSLGLKGELKHKDFRAMVRNRHPRSLNQKLTERDKVGRRIGWDISFSPPKSLSLLWTVTQDQRLVEAMQQAANETMRMMEEYACVRVRKRGADHDRNTGNAAWAMFTHYTSRPVEDGVIPDPQLHCHAFLFNAAYDKEEQTWKALQNGGMRKRARYFEAVFHAKLSQAVKELGYGVDRRGDARWEIAGVSRDLIERFSSRAKQIHAKAKALGLRDPTKIAALGEKTRSRKAQDITLDQLHKLWGTKLSKSEWYALVEADTLPSSPTLSADDALDHAVAHCFERHAVVADYLIKEEALRYAMGSVTPEDIDTAFEKRDWLRATDANGVTSVSTLKILAEEKWLCDVVRRGRGQYASLGDPDRVIGPKHMGSEIIHLNADQQAACRHIWGCHDLVMSIRGKAGTGKTTLIMEAVRGIEAHGKHVIALAPSAEASRGVLRDAGLKDADTIEMFLTNPAMRQRAKDQVILVDEASLVGVRTMVRLMKEAEKLNARVILMGDAAQHKSVDRGDVLKLLHKFAGVKPVSIATILRQKGDYKKAVIDLSNGKTKRGFKQLDQMGCIQEIEDDDKRYAALAKGYADAMEQGKSVLAVSPTHAEGHVVTQAIRDELKKRGLIDTTKIQACTSMKNQQWTDARRKEASRYEAGMAVFFNKPAPGFQAGSWASIHCVRGNQVIVQDKQGKLKPLPLKLAERFQVYRPQQMELAKGDIILFTQNTHGMLAGTKRKVSNGTLWRINGFSPKTNNPIITPIENGTAFEVSINNGHFTHGFCSTSHASQGKTVDHIFIAQASDSFPASNREQFYVSVSRGKQQAHIFTDNKTDLLQAVDQSDPRTSAIELQRKAKREIYLNHAARQTYHRTITRQRQWHQKHQQSQTHETRRRAKQRLRNNISRSYIYER